MHPVTTRALALGIAGALLPLTPALAADAETLERGRYVNIIGGCNDCHTPDYALSEGQTPEARWLTGDVLGWHGPWGTTYAPNLRLKAAAMSVEEWVEMSRTLRTRPPMPWFNLNQMSAEDAAALYHYIRSLGEPGEPAPAALPPGETPPVPYADFVVK
ncbi:cytochrome C [Halomonas campisalis]|uniref:Cytochrome C n=1 Tax=Billgrantia campisalis TaxID=74661 RepID=A0ABS9P834_9GAMM|nr:c-type cytochrome [Halomonas campisalis]MCG6657927.1 cytochrome C [Halomonas campisalis]MDR5863548.1 hypothetical protein [Halomonas campisalis]